MKKTTDDKFQVKAHKKDKEQLNETDTNDLVFSSVGPFSTFVINHAWFKRRSFFVEIIMQEFYSPKGRLSAVIKHRSVNSNFKFMFIFFTAMTLH